MRGHHALAALAAALLLAAPAVQADPTQITVPTTWLTHAQHKATAPVPGDLLAEWKGNGGAQLTSTPPPGTGAVPGGSPLLYGSTEVGARPFLVALGRKGEQGGVLAVDLNGDRSLSGPGEVLEKSGRLGKLHGAAVLRWKFPKQVIGPLEVAFEFRQLFRCCDAFLVAPSGKQALTLADAPPAGVQAVSGAQTIKYTAIPGAKGATAVAFLRGEGDRLTVFIDLNRNGTLGEGGEVFPAPIRAREGGTRFWSADGIPYEGANISFALREIEPEAQVTWKAKVTGARRGTARLGNADCQLHLLDGDGDGSFTSKGDWWWFGPASVLAARKDLTTTSMLPVSQHFRVGGVPWGLISVGADGGALLMKDEKAPHPHAYLHERTEHVNRDRWFPLFARDTHFPADQGVDLSRPKTPTPPAWVHDVGLDAALAKARQVNKPLLVDYEADWCSVCKRWDFHVYNDQEVAGLLSRFILLKINGDFCFTDDLQRFGGTNPPFLVFLDTAGNPLLSFPFVDSQGNELRQANGLNHFQRPTDFVATLKAALQQWEARQGR